MNYQELKQYVLDAKPHGRRRKSSNISKFP